MIMKIIIIKVIIKSAKYNIKKKQKCKNRTIKQDLEKKWNIVMSQISKF